MTVFSSYIPHAQLEFSACAVENAKKVCIGGGGICAILASRRHERIFWRHERILCGVKASSKNLIDLQHPHFTVDKGFDTV